MSSAFQRLFGVFKDARKQYNISIETRKETVFRYVVGLQVFIAILVNIAHYMKKARTIVCETNTCEENMDSFEDLSNCSMTTLPYLETHLCIHDINVIWYKWYPYYLIIITLIMFIVGNFEVSQYRHKEAQFLRLVNTHFDPYSKDAIEDFERVLRGDVLKHQQEARDCLSLFSGRNTLYRTDFIRYIVGSVLSGMVTFSYTAIAVAYIYISESFEGFHCDSFKALCKLTSLRPYSFCSILLCFLNGIYFGFACYYWKRVKDSECLTAIKNMTKMYSRFSQGKSLRNGSVSVMNNTALMYPIMLTPNPSFEDIFTRNSWTSSYSNTMKYQRLSQNIVPGSGAEIEIQHMVSKLCIANGGDVGVYVLAKFDPEFEKPWKVGGLELKVFDTKTLIVKWNSAPILENLGRNDPEGFVENWKMYKGAPSYNVYLYTNKKLLVRKGKDPLDPKHSDFGEYSLEFPDVIPGNEYIVAVVTKLGNYFITCAVAKITLDPPKVDVNVVTIKETSAEISWVQLPQDLYCIVGYKVTVTCMRHQEIVSATEFDPSWNKYEYLVKNLNPNRKYKITLQALTKKSKSETTVEIHTKEK